MTDKIAEIRARHEAVDNVLRGSAQMHDDRGYLLAEVERQARHIKELREKIDAERSCACSFDGPGDICAAHSPALMDARAEVDRLHKAHEAACAGGELLRSTVNGLFRERDEARAENARLRDQVSEYFREPATHPVEGT